MAGRSPRGDRPDLIVASHPRAKLPCTESALYLGETIYNLIHSRTLLRILLDHVGDECFHEFEAIVLLIYDSELPNLKTKRCEPVYSPP